MCVHFLASIGTPKRTIWKTPFSCIETIAKINECCRVLPLRTLFVKYHLATIGVAGPFVKGEYARELCCVSDISHPRDRQPVMDVFVHDEPRAELQAGSRSHLRPSKL